MVASSVELHELQGSPAVSVARWRPMWETRVSADGFMTVIAHVQALNGTDPATGYLRARNATTGALTNTNSVFGLNTRLELPELPVADGDLVVIEARPELVGQVYAPYAKAVIHDTALTKTPNGAIPALFGVINIASTGPIVGDTFVLNCEIAAGTEDLNGELTVEVEWITPDGSNPMGGTDVGGGWFRNYLQNANGVPSQLQFNELTFVTQVAGIHRWRFVATNSLGSVVSPEIVFDVPSSPTVSITQQPVDTTGPEGGTATFTVATDGGLTHWWYRAPAASPTAFAYIPGSDSPSYTTPPLTAAESGDQFRVIIDGSVGFVTSETVTLTVETAPTTSPANTSPPVITGPSTVGGTLTASEGGWSGVPTPTYAYQWLRDGTPIAGATGTTYQTVAADTDTAVACRVTATNPAGTASATSAPMTITAPTGGDASFVRGAYVSSQSLATTHTIDSADITPAPVAGDKVLLIMAAPGPSDVGSVSYTHPAGTIVVDAPGDAYSPRLRVVQVDYTGPTTWQVAANTNIRPAAVAMANTGTVTAAAPVSSATPTDPGPIANPDLAVGLAITSLNFTNGEVTGPPPDHTTVLNSGSGIRQLYVAERAVGAAGVYDPGPATVGPGSESGTAVAIVAHPGGGGSTTPTGAYTWEDRLAAIEPNPDASAGTPEKNLADFLGLTHRVSVSSVSAYQSAVAGASPGRQIYVTATLTGNGTSQLLSYYGNENPIGSTGSAASGTEQNRILTTCAPSVWIDGGQTAGQQNTSSRCITVRGVRHVGFYKCNFRRATFPVKFDQCHGTAAAPIVFHYNEVAESGHALLHIGGYHTRVNDIVGGSSHISVTANYFRDAGIGSNQYGEACYIGYGSGPRYDTSPCHHIDVIGNRYERISAEACDAKPGCHHIRFNHNLVTDCADSIARSGNAANEGFPGSVQMFPASDSIYPAGYSTQPSGYVCDSEVVGNRWFRCTSNAQKYPTGQVLLAHRGIKAIGNAFEQCTVPGSGQIRIYIEDGQSFGNNGTIEVHNNTSKDARTLLDTFIGGGSNASELANAQNNTNASNNVGTSSQTGVDVVVGAGDFGDDGTGYEGSGFAVAEGGALDVIGADTSALWATDFAGVTIAAPVQPGARQLAPVAARVDRSDPDGTWDTSGPSDPSETFTMVDCPTTDYRWQYRIDDPISGGTGPSGWQDVPGSNDSATFELTAPSAVTYLAANPAFDSSTMTGEGLTHTLTFYVRGSCDAGATWFPEYRIDVPYDFEDS